MGYWLLSLASLLRISTLPPTIHSRTKAAQLVEEIRALVAEALSEQVLEEHFLYVLGCDGYTPRPDLGGPSFSVWLTQIADELSAAWA